MNPVETLAKLIASTTQLIVLSLLTRSKILAHIFHTIHQMPLKKHISHTYNNEQQNKNHKQRQQ